MNDQRRRMKKKMGSGFTFNRELAKDVLLKSRVTQHFFRASAITFLISLILSHAANAQTVDAMWLGGSGNWSDATLWSTNPNFPNNGSQHYSVTIQGGSIALDQTIVIDDLILGASGLPTLPDLDLTSSTIVTNTFTLKSGMVVGAGALTVNNVLEWNSGSMLGTGTTQAMNGIFFNGVSSSSDFGQLDRTLICYGNSLVQTVSSYFENLNFVLHA